MIGLVVLLADPKGWHLPTVLGELVAGIVVGTAGLRYVDPSDLPSFRESAFGTALAA